MNIQLNDQAPLHSPKGAWRGNGRRGSPNRTLWGWSQTHSWSQSFTAHLIGPVEPRGTGKNPNQGPGGRSILSRLLPGLSQQSLCPVSCHDPSWWAVEQLCQTKGVAAHCWDTWAVGKTSLGSYRTYHGMFRRGTKSGAREELKGFREEQVWKYRGVREWKGPVACRQLAGRCACLAMSCT